MYRPKMPTSSVFLITRVLEPLPSENKTNGSESACPQLFCRWCAQQAHTAPKAEPHKGQRPRGHRSQPCALARPRVLPNRCSRARKSALLNPAPWTDTCAPVHRGNRHLPAQPHICSVFLTFAFCFLQLGKLCLDFVLSCFALF